MTNLFRHNPLPCQPSIRRKRRRRLLLLLLVPLAGAVLALASCSDGTPKPPLIPATDTAPVGDGLKVIGYALLGAAVVVVLGRMIR